MHTLQSLLKDLKQLEIKENDVLMVHSSMKAVGDVQGGAETVLDALSMSVQQGLLVLPTHTWASMSAAHPVYDRRFEPACVGILPNLFMKRKGVVRSFHPTHSVAALGAGAENFIQGEENRTTPCCREGSYGRLYDLGAKIMLLGCGMNRNTYLHGVEEWFGITERLTPETLPLQIVLEDGQKKACSMHKHYKPDGISISEYYVKMERPLTEAGILKSGKVGDAPVLIMDARKTADLFTKYLTKDRDAFLDMRELPQLL